MSRIDQDQADRLVVRASHVGQPGMGLGRYTGIVETPLVGGAAEGLAAGPLNWPHGFVVRRLDLATG
ncbi:hypothetical protein ABTJ98_21235, partial [Acinetobacter baumannii]